MLPPSLLFPHGHPDTSFLSAPSLPNCSRSESAGQAHLLTSGEELATWSIPRTPQVMNPKSSTRLLLQVETRRLSTIRTTITSLTSQKSHARTLDCAVFPQRWNHLFRTFLMVKSKKGRFSMSKKSRRNNNRSHFLHTHREFYHDERDLREDLERRAQQAVLGENSLQRKIFLSEYDLEIQHSERKNQNMR